MLTELSKMHFNIYKAFFRDCSKIFGWFMWETTFRILNGLRMHGHSIYALFVHTPLIPRISEYSFFPASILDKRLMATEWNCSPCAFFWTLLSARVSPSVAIFSPKFQGHCQGTSMQKLSWHRRGLYHSTTPTPLYLFYGILEPLNWEQIWISSSLILS